MMDLRDYQQEALEAIETGFQKGIQKPVLVLATGLGKTVVFAHLISTRNKKTHKKALVLAHREELLTQAKEKIEKVDPSLKVEIEMADQHASQFADVVVASVATIGRSNGNRIDKLDPKEFGTIVIDEAHHASASTYKNVLQHFGILKDKADWNKDCLLLGVTATPSRNDNEGIDQVFDNVVYQYGILEGIQNGWLSRIRAYRADTKTSLAAVHTLAGDFKQDELASAINNPERNTLVVKTYQEQFAGKQALVFGVDVSHAEALKQTFEDQGIRAEMITGTTHKEIRKNYLEWFHNKEIQVIVNCMVLTEGYDNDTIDVIMMARPTKSGILYSQMVGRGTRTHHEKPFLTIVDFVDNTAKHSIKTSSSLLGVEGSVDFAGRDILESFETIKDILDRDPTFDLNRLDFDRLEYIMEEVDLTGGLDIPKPLQGITHYTWMRFGQDGFRISLGNNRYIIIREQLTGQWKARYQKWDSAIKKLFIEELGEEKELEKMVSRVDSYISNNYEDSLRLVDMHAKWMSDPVSDAQSKELRRLGVSPTVIESLDKGKASRLQNKLYGEAALKKLAW